MDISTEVKATYEKGLEAKKRAYAPFSKYTVGAAFGLKSGEIFAGCNIENPSFGATMCAERSAIYSAIAQKGVVPFSHLVVITDDDPPAFPCAFCLQVIAEFCDLDFPIFLANTEGVKKRLLLRDLLPHPFTSKTLLEKHR